MAVALRLVGVVGAWHVARTDTKMMHGDERDKHRRYTPHSHALGWACTDSLAPETGWVLAKTKTKTYFSSPSTSLPAPPLSRILMIGPA